MSDGEFREEATASIFFKSLHSLLLLLLGHLEAPPHTAILSVHLCPCCRRRRRMRRKGAQLPKCCIVDKPGKHVSLLLSVRTLSGALAALKPKSKQNLGQTRSLSSFFIKFEKEKLPHISLVILRTKIIVVGGGGREGMPLSPSSHATSERDRPWEDSAAASASVG